MSRRGWVRYIRTSGFHGIGKNRNSDLIFSQQISCHGLEAERATSLSLETKSHSVACGLRSARGPWLVVAIQRIFQLMAQSKALLQVLICSSLAMGASVQAETVKYTLVNGDTVSGELLKDESTDDVRVLLSPVLGRIEIDVSSIKVPETPPRWKSTITGGFSGNNTDSSNSFGGNLNASSLFKDSEQSLKLTAGFNYNSSKKQGESTKISAKKANAGVMYDKFLNPNLNLYATSTYNYDRLKDAGTDNVLASIGVGFPVIDTDIASLTLRIGPSLTWSGGGKDCSTDEYCGNAYGGGAFIADFGWKPTTWLRLGVVNQFGAAFASEIKPANTFTATIKLFPSSNSNLFTSLKYQSIYQSMTSPTTNNTLSGQVGVEF